MKSVVQSHIPPRVLTIAGSDSGGSAGIQADLKTFTARGVFGMSAITLVTAQNTQGVQRVEVMPAEIVASQMHAVLDDIGLTSAKTGLLFKADIVTLVADILPDIPLIVDPVLVNGSGKTIVSSETIEAYKTKLFPRATVITPNLDEAMLLSGIERIEHADDFRKAARIMHDYGVDFVLMKGGHMETEEIVDILFDGDQFYEWRKPALPIKNPHGIGCTYASAIAAEVAKGNSVVDAVETAHAYVYRALKGALAWQLGQGRSPVNHFVDL